MITYQIVVAFAALLALILKTVLPGFPLDQEQILALLLFLLGLGGIYPQLMLRRGLTGTDGWLKSKALWLAVAGIIDIVVHSYAPDFPLVAANFAALILWVLGLGGIVPEVRALKAKLAKK